MREAIKIKIKKPFFRAHTSVVFHFDSMVEGYIFKPVYQSLEKQQGDICTEQDTSETKKSVCSHRHRSKVKGYKRVHW